MIYKHKKYIGSIEYSKSDKCWHGKILNVFDLVTYESRYYEDLENEFEQAVDDYEQTKKEVNMNK